MGENLMRGKRVFLGMSQEQLAKIIGWRQEYVSQVERGVRLIPKDKAAAFATALKMLPQELPTDD